VEVASWLDAMRGNDAPRDLLIRIRGGESDLAPWAVYTYANSHAVKDFQAEQWSTTVEDVRLVQQVGSAPVS
jgi:hypothetical protein